MAKYKEKAEVRNVLKESHTIFQVLSPLNQIFEPLRDQNEVSVLPWEVVSDLLHHLETHKSMGMNEIHPRVVRELAEMFIKCFQAFTRSCSSLGVSHLIAALQM